MSKIFIISNTNFNLSKNLSQKEWLKNMDYYFYNEFVPYLINNIQPNDILIHLGNFLCKTKTIDLSDSLGNSIWVYNKGVSHTLNFQNKKSNSNEHDQIIRFLPYSIANLNNSWISDKTRFSFDGLYINRLKAFKCFGFNNNNKIQKSLFLKNQIDIFKFLNNHQTQFLINFNQIKINFV